MSGFAGFSVISTFKPMQNRTGGFGGGHGQMSHCAPSFAAVLSLALVGGNETFQIVDRLAMWVSFRILSLCILNLSAAS